MARFVLTLTKDGSKVDFFSYTDREKKSVLQGINLAISSYTSIGFFERMDLRDWLYSTSVVKGVAERMRDGVLFSLVCEKNGVCADPIAKEHTPYFTPQTKEEIMAEYYERRESGLLPR